MLSRQEALEQLTAPGGPFELTHQDAAGAPQRVYATGPRTLRDVLAAGRVFGEREFLVYDADRITYADHLRQVARFAAWLREEGVQKGDRVGICMRNYPEWSITFFACQAIGAVAVTLNAWWTGSELVYGLTDSACRVVVVDDERYARLAPLRGELPGLTVVVARDAERAIDDQGVVHLGDALAAHPDRDEPPDADVGPADIASIMYTSGTTGFPKGALHTHRNHVTNIQNTLLAGAAGALIAGTASGSTVQGCALQTFPFFHIGGLSGLYITYVTGGKLVLMYRWDVGEALALIRSEGVMSVSAVPTVVRQLLEHPEATVALGAVGSIASGGAPVPADLIDRVGRQFDRRVTPANGYGATETTSAIVTNGGDDYLARPTSVGRPVMTADVRIVDDHGDDCAPGAIGELWVSGPNVFAGYWNKPDETAASFDAGWFKTGDLGYVDTDGFYYVVDRKKDVIIRAGENIYCAEVEGVLHEHPDVADVALIGLPHRSLGEEVAAVIELKSGAQLTEADIQNRVAERLARFNVPTRVFFTNEPLPRTATGKILKRELKQRYGG